MRWKDCFRKDKCPSYGNCQHCGYGGPVCKVIRELNKRKKEIIVGLYDGIYDFSFVLNGKFYRRHTDLKTGEEIYPKDEQARKLYDLILKEDYSIFEAMKKEYPGYRIICTEDGHIFDTIEHEEERTL